MCRQERAVRIRPAPAASGTELRKLLSKLAAAWRNKCTALSSERTDQRRSSRPNCSRTCVFVQPAPLVQALRSPTPRGRLDLRCQRLTLPPPPQVFSGTSLPVHSKQDMYVRWPMEPPPLAPSESPSRFKEWPWVESAPCACGRAPSRCGEATLKPCEINATPG